MKNKIDFLKLKFVFLTLSLFFCFLSFFCLLKNGLNFGLEFSGGIEVELKTKRIIELDFFSEKLRDFSISKIKYYGSKYDIQIKIKNYFGDINSLINEMKIILSDDIKIMKMNYIGAEINKENINNSITAIILSILFMLFYLSFRFENRMALCALIALIHDIILLIGIISFLKLEFNLIVLSSIFTTFGYSVNDTIIVFDRIRENLVLNKNSDKYFIINLSINNTLSRTLVTSLSTLLVTIVLMFFAGEHIFYFAFLFFIGIIVGTYSSIYIASSLYFLLNKFFEK